MWFGLAAIAITAWFTVLSSSFDPWSTANYAGFGVWLFIEVLLIGGLIYTFKDKKSKDEQKE